MTAFGAAPGQPDRQPSEVEQAGPIDPAGPRSSAEAQSISRPADAASGAELLELRQQVADLHRRLEALQGQLRRLETGAGSEGAVKQHLADAGSTVLQRPPPSFDWYLFAERFRGPTALVRSQQRSYLPLFTGLDRALDLGCGRGEFLGLLAEAGVAALGVEDDADLVAYCRGKGLNVINGNLLDVLAAQLPGSADGLFAAQLVERLEPTELPRLAHLIYRCLRPGGLAVVETVNVHCPAALASFYLDPRRLRPVPVGLPWFSFEQAGFKISLARFSASTGPDLLAGTELDLHDLRAADRITRYQTCAIVARRPADEAARLEH